ncbi:hypothetical protein M8J77_010109 [Diaphorina citri]|nr:hypothetical protein M8J77_010109 [Diaphorina citri]
MGMSLNYCLSFPGRLPHIVDTRYAGSVRSNRQLAQLCVTPCICIIVSIRQVAWNTRPVVSRQSPPTVRPKASHSLSGGPHRLKKRELNWDHIKPE